MYRVPPAAELLSQGDIFQGSFPFTFIEEPAAPIQVIRGDQALNANEVADAWHEESEAVLSVARVNSFVIILSQSCDAENLQKPALDYVLVGAVRPITDLPPGRQGDCRRNRFVRFHYLRADPTTNFPESYVHFGLLTSISQPSLVAFKASRILALDFPHREDLGHRFGEFFSRVALP